MTVGDLKRLLNNFDDNINLYYAYDHWICMPVTQLVIADLSKKNSNKFLILNNAQRWKYDKNRIDEYNPNSKVIYNDPV